MVVSADSYGHPERSEGPHDAHGSTEQVGSFGLWPQDDSSEGELATLGGAMEGLSGFDDEAVTLERLEERRLALGTDGARDRPEGEITRSVKVEEEHDHGGIARGRGLRRGGTCAAQQQRPCREDARKQ